MTYKSFLNNFTFVKINLLIKRFFMVLFNNKEKIISSSSPFFPYPGLTQKSAPISKLKNANPGDHTLSIKFGTLLYSVFSLLIDSIKIRQNTILIQSEQLNDNTNIQQQLNQETNAIKFAVVPSDASQAEITKTQNINQNYSAERNNLQDLLITARQNGQIILTNTSTNINIMQQLAAKDSSFLKILNNIGSVVNGMSQPPS